MAYENVSDGEWIDITDGEWSACCDCGLVHDMEYAVLDGRILRRCYRENRRTGLVRRAMKRKKEGIWKSNGGK